MRIIKLLLISIVAFGLLLSIFSLFIPSGFSVIKSVSVPVTPDKVAPYLEDLREWNNWNLLAGGEAPVSGTVSSNELKTGRFNVTKQESEVNQVVTIWTDGKRSLNSIMDYGPAPDDENSTMIQWYMHIQTKWYPWEKFASMIFDKQLDKPMESSLDSLKSLILKNH